MLLSVVALSGCVDHEPVRSLVTPAGEVQRAPTEKSQQVERPDIMSSGALQSPDDAGHAGNIQQCRKELEAMRTFSEASYNSYLAEFKQVGAQTNKYLQIKDNVGSDINELVMPGYQYQIRKLCFRIKSRLTQLIIRQVN